MLKQENMDALTALAQALEAKRLVETSGVTPEQAERILTIRPGAERVEIFRKTGQVYTYHFSNRTGKYVPVNMRTSPGGCALATELLSA
jgi:hypothetical protein